MTLRSATLCLMLLCLAPVTSVQAASFDFFLKFDGIDGESTSRGHEKWIDVSAYDFGVSRTTGGGGGTTSGQPVFEDFSFTKLLDSASPKILEAVVLGDPIPTATFDIVKNGDRPSTVFSYSFKDVLLSSLHHSGAEPGLPNETVSFSFGSVKLQSFLQDPRGGTIPGPSFAFDLASPATVPEPATWLSMAAGMAALMVGMGRVGRLPGRRSGTA